MYIFYFILTLNRWRMIKKKTISYDIKITVLRSYIRIPFMPFTERWLEKATNIR